MNGFGKCGATVQDVRSKQKNRWQQLSGWNAGLIRDENWIVAGVRAFGGAGRSHIFRNGSPRRPMRTTIDDDLQAHMSDLVERLVAASDPNAATETGVLWNLCEEAADKILGLRIALAGAEARAVPEGWKLTPWLG